MTPLLITYFKHSYFIYNNNNIDICSPILQLYQTCKLCFQLAFVFMRHCLEKCKAMKKSEQTSLLHQDVLLAPTALFVTQLQSTHARVSGGKAGICETLWPPACNIHLVAILSDCKHSSSHLLPPAPDDKIVQLFVPFN